MRQEAMYVQEQGVYGKSLYLPLSFQEPKLLYKKTFYSVSHLVL